MTLFRLEFELARAMLAVFRALGPVAASNVGGWLARAVGPLLPVSRVAHINLQLAMPELDRAAAPGGAGRVGEPGPHGG